MHTMHALTVIVPILADTVTNVGDRLVSTILPIIDVAATLGILASLGLMAIHHHNAPTYLKTSIGALVLSLIAQPTIHAILTAGGRTSTMRPVPGGAMMQHGAQHAYAIAHVLALRA